MGFPFFLFFCLGYGVLGVRFLYLGGIRSHNYTNVALFIKLPFCIILHMSLKLCGGWVMWYCRISVQETMLPEGEKDITRDRV